MVAAAPSKAAVAARSDEFVLIDRILGRLRATARGPRLLVGSGDDAAVTRPAPVTVTSVDLSMEGVHFDRKVSSPEQIGWKAVATALSDIAAMGAGAGEIYVQIALPDDLSEEECLGVADGIGAIAAATGSVVAGGDISRSPSGCLALGVTVVGHCGSADEPVTRDGARPGDHVVVTGALGGAAAGLVLIEDERVAATLEASVAEDLIHRQLEPRPRLAAGRALASAGARAMIDLSDGLAGDAAHIATASGADLVINASLLPLDEGVEHVATWQGVDPVTYAAAGGEDYELLATIAPERLDDAAARLEAEGLALTVIGEVREPPGPEPPSAMRLLAADGSRLDLTGFDQLRDRPRRRSRSHARRSGPESG